MSTSRQPSIPAGRGCVLRPWHQEDAAELVLALRDPLIREYSTRLIESREDALQAIQGWTQRWVEHLGAAWAVRSQAAGGELLGAVQYALHDPELSCGSVGYWLVPQARGQGLARAALSASSVQIFDRLGWHRIELSHATQNERSCAVARRAGYPAEGILRSAMVAPRDGQRHDQHLHARLRTDPPPASGRY